MCACANYPLGIVDAPEGDCKLPALMRFRVVDCFAIMVL